MRFACPVGRLLRLAALLVALAHAGCLQEPPADYTIAHDGGDAGASRDAAAPAADAGLDAR